ncbi:MAG: endonuclease/exonuclease/phosphatase family protein [Planctomycetota bacterium]
MRCAATLQVALAICNCLPTCLASPIKVMSFNVRYDGSPKVADEGENAWFAANGKHRRDLIGLAVREFAPDILCVQEALKNQVDDIRAILPTHGFYGVGRDDGVERGEHCGIFFQQDRFDRRHSGTFWLNSDSSVAGTKFPGTCCARIASWCVFRDRQNQEREILVVNTHWDHQIQAARIYSAKLIRRKLAAIAAGMSIVVAGDLNVPDANEAFRKLVRPSEQYPLALLDTYRVVHPAVAKAEGTYHAFRGKNDGHRIDYVLHDSTLRCVKADIIRLHEGARYPSDHFPVTATLTFQNDD